MKKISSVLFIAALVFSACKNSVSFKKGLDDLEYKIIADGSGKKIQYGEFMQMHFSTIYNNGKSDSVLNDSRTMGGPMIEVLDSVSTPKAYFEILRQMRKGDSVVIRILTDSAFKTAPDQMPPFIKKGHHLITTVKILNIFSTREQADSARNAEMLLAQKRDSINAIAQLTKDDKILKEYFAKNNIQAVKAPGGTYVQIIKPGTGPNVDTSNVVMTYYTGKTMDGKMFDSNTDPSRGKSEPFRVNMTNNPSLGNPVITGWKDGLQLLNKGAIAKFYIPSSLAYGARGAGSEIAPNANLVFDIEVVDILSRDQAQVQLDQRMKEVEVMRKKYQDSVNAVQADTSRK